MNHCVPIFHEMEEDDSIPTPSGFPIPKKPAAGEEDIMELLWRNGQVVVHQNQRQAKKSAFGGGGEELIQTEREIRSSTVVEQHHLFMQEDEMSSWLQYPLDDSSFDRDLYSDFLYAPPPPPSPIAAIPQPTAVTEIRPPPPPPPPPPPMPPTITKPESSPRVQNFVHFSRLPIRQRTDSTPAMRKARQTTVVESNETPKVGPESRVSHMVPPSMPQANAESGTATAGGTSATAGDIPAGTYDLTLTSSPGGSRTSFSASEDTLQPPQKPPVAAVNRKRKAKEPDDNECQSEDIEFEAAHDAKKHTRGSTSTKRSRAAEVHNQSERRRRDRINEKMKALQELIPRCNKSDKASMLDEAIEYLKSLQLQVQMMSMGCGMVPMMYSGMQQFMPAMGFGMGIGMDMNRPMVPYTSMIPGSGMPAAAHMGMDMNRPPMVPYPSIIPGSGMPAAAHMAAPRFPMPPFQMPTVPATNSLATHNHNQPRMPNFVDPYQQFIGLHHAQLPLQQNQAVVQPGSTKPTTSKGIGNHDNNHRNG